MEKSTKSILTIGLSLLAIGGITWGIVHLLKPKKDDKSGGDKSNGGDNTSGSNTSTDNTSSGGTTSSTPLVSGVYPKVQYSAASNSSGVAVRTKPVVNDGYVSNLIKRVKYPEKIGTFIEDVKGGDQMTWHHIKFDTPLIIDNNLYKEGYVRSDVSDVK